jgi:hypothetical protein
MNVDYNTSRNHLILSEYGRNIQRLVEHLKTIEDKEARNRFANGIISVMGQLNPHLRDVMDYKHKLWDHLFIIAGFELDVDSPYPIPVKENFDTKPQLVPYSINKIRYRFYGKNTELMLKKAAEMQDGPEKTAFINSIGSFMKISCKSWNDENITDEAVADHITVMSNGELKIDLQSEDINFEYREKNLVQRKPLFVQNNAQNKNRFNKNNRNKNNNPNAKKNPNQNNRKQKPAS